MIRFDLKSQNESCIVGSFTSDEPHEPYEKKPDPAANFTHTVNFSLITVTAGSFRTLPFSSCANCSRWSLQLCTALFRWTPTLPLCHHLSHNLHDHTLHHHHQQHIPQVLYICSSHSPHNWVFILFNNFLPFLFFPFLTNSLIFTNGKCPSYVNGSKNGISIFSNDQTLWVASVAAQWLWDSGWSEVCLSVKFCAFCTYVWIFPCV